MYYDEVTLTGIKARESIRIRLLVLILQCIQLGIIVIVDNIILSLQEKLSAETN